MRVGWIADQPNYIGGAELTHKEFRDAAPVEVVDCPAGDVKPDLDLYVAHNVVQYRDLTELEPLDGKIVWYHHDLSPWIDPTVRALLDKQRHIFCSPSQQERYGAEGACIPPYIDRDRLSPPRQARKRREGTCSIASWRGPGKGAHDLARWAKDNGPVHVYGDPDFAPAGPNIEYRGLVQPGQVAQTLWRYERFAFLPFDFEPFCRCVAEAWAAGTEVVTNKLVGALHWINEDPEAMGTAREDFWETVLA